MTDPASSFDAEQLLVTTSTTGAMIKARDPMIPMIPMPGSFERSDLAGTFQLSEFREGIDEIAPERVTDLRITAGPFHISGSYVVLDLEWTSTGDDSFDGIGTFLAALIKSLHVSLGLFKTSAIASCARQPKK